MGRSIGGRQPRAIASVTAWRLTKKLAVKELTRAAEEIEALPDDPDGRAVELLGSPLSHADLAVRLMRDAS